MKTDPKHTWCSIRSVKSCLYLTVSNLYGEVQHEARETILMGQTEMDSGCWEKAPLRGFHLKRARMQRTLLQECVGDSKSIDRRFSAVARGLIVIVTNYYAVMQFNWRTNKLIFISIHWRINIIVSVWYKMRMLTVFKSASKEQCATR